MSEQNENSPTGSSSQGSGNRNRSRNRNRNRNRNPKSSGGGSGGRGGQGNSPRRRHNNAEGPRRRTPKPKPLTTWQKILKFLGLYKPETEGQKGGGQEKSGRPRKENVRDVSGRRSAGSGGKTARARQKPRPIPDSSQVEGKRLYVGNLSYDAAEHDLEDLFKGVGAVRKIEIVYNRNTHRSKGYGFVEMARVEEAKRAVEVLHDQPFMGRTLIVNGARSKGPLDSDGDPAPQENPPPNLPENDEE